MKTLLIERLDASGGVVKRDEIKEPKVDGLILSVGWHKPNVKAYRVTNFSDRAVQVSVRTSVRKAAVAVGTVEAGASAVFSRPRH